MHRTTFLSLALLLASFLLNALPAQELRIVEMRATGAGVVDHGSLTGDDRGGIAVGIDKVLVTGDSATASYNLTDLGGGASLGTRFDSLCSDLGTGIIYTLALNGVPHSNSNSSINQLLEINPATGALTGTEISLSTPISLTTSNNGVFSGNGRVVIYNGSQVYDIALPSGVVNPLGTMVRPSWRGSESWAVWGVVEFFDGRLHLAYCSGANTFERARVPDGATQTIASFTSLSDLASWTISPDLSRWYFHYEGSGQFGGTSETLGYADAIINSGPPTTAPRIFNSDSIRTAADREFELQIVASGSPTSYGATGLPAGLTVDPTSGLITGSIATAGSYNFQISATNAIGTTAFPVTLTVLTVVPPEDFEIVALESTGSTITEATYTGYSRSYKL